MLKNSSVITENKKYYEIFWSGYLHISTAQIGGNTLFWNPTHMCSFVQTHNIQQVRTLRMPSTTTHGWDAKCTIPVYLEMPRPYPIHRINSSSVSNAILEEKIQHLKVEPSTGLFGWLPLHQPLEGGSAPRHQPASSIPQPGLLCILGRQVGQGQAWSRWTTRISLLQQGRKAE